MTSKMLKKTMRYAEVAPAVPMRSVGVQTYTYEIPPEVKEKLSLYSRVDIPLGSRVVPGVVLSVHNRKVRFATKRLKSPSRLKLSVGQVQFAEWIARTMHGSLGYTLRLFFPAAKREKELKTAKEVPLKEIAAPRRLILKGWFSRLESEVGVLLEEDMLKRLMKLAEISQYVMEERDQVLIMVPEKWMIDVFEPILRQYFRGSLAVVRSGMRTAEYGEVWQRIARGEVKIVIGTQKALYLPWHNLGLVIMEQEHYVSHKLGDAYPRLDNRYALVELARRYACPLLFSGGVWSLNLWYQVRHEGAVVLVDNPRQIKVKVLEDEYSFKGRRQLLPRRLVWLLKNSLTKRERVFILYNQRGSWSVTVCKSCNKSIKCPECEVSLVAHGKKGGQSLVCNHCNYTRLVPNRCPACNKGELKFFGLGAEKMVDILGKLLPKVQIEWLDAKTSRDWSDLDMLSFWNIRQPKILVGTTAALRLISKDGVDRVIWLQPERAMRYPDYRSEERTVALIARLQELLPKGRHVWISSRQGQVVSEVIADAGKIFFEKQLKERQCLLLPPYTDMVRLTARAKDGQVAKRKAVKWRKDMEAALVGVDHKIVIKGPYSGFVKKRRGQAEAHLILQGQLEKLAPLYEKLPVDVVDVGPERII